MRTNLVGLTGSLVAMLFFGLASSHAQSGHTVITTQDADYYGFDLRTEPDVTLSQCEAACLADENCRAFTYNTRAQWCFLKSDWGALNPFEGAVAGRIVPEGGTPDIGAAPQLDFLPASLRDEARQYRGSILSGMPQTGQGGAFLTSVAMERLAAGNARGAIEAFRSALALAPDESGLWQGLSVALLRAEPQDWRERADLPRDASSAAINAYLTSRTTEDRAGALRELARALDRRDLYRPAIEAYDASLALADVASVSDERAALRARRGFRVMDHTVDTEAAEPRICVQLSEDLPRSGVDFASFVTLDSEPAPAVDASGQQICVEGLRHGRHYRVTLRQGLPSAIGETLLNDVALSVYVRDRTPSLRFSGENFVLPSTMRRGIPLVSVNADRADINLYRIGDRALARVLSEQRFLRRLGGWDVETIADDLGQPVWEGMLDIAADLNREVVTAFPVDEALPEREPGVYVLVAVPEDDTSEPWQARATQWFVVSDIGLSTFAGADGLSVYARSLASARPLPGTHMQLVARNNEILGTAMTDADGVVRFDAGLMRGTGGMAPTLVMASGDDGDFVFLDLNRAGFDLSDRGVAGRDAPGALDVLPWTERGVYRASETVHLNALVRDDTAMAVEHLPLTLILSRPDGVEDRRIVSTQQTLGGHSFSMPLSDNAMRGSWSAALHVDADRPPLARTGFLVEDFVPDRIAFEMEANVDTLLIDEAAQINIEGRYLYGAPAQGLELEGEIAITTTREWAAFPGYRFGLSDEEELGSEVVPLTVLPETDAEGRAQFDVALDILPATTRLIEAGVTLRMREAGGRAVERRLTLPVMPETAMIGIRPDFTDGSVPENTTASFSVIMADSAGERRAHEGLRWSLKKTERSHQWYRTQSGWNYEPVSYTSEVASGRIAVGTDDPARIALPVEWGRYRLEIETADPLGPATSIAFEAGWFVEATATETPDALEIALDRERYADGETARLRISPRFSGEVLVTVGSDRLHETITATIAQEGGEVAIPVTGAWGAGAYVTATLYRPGEAAESRMPARAIGVTWLSVDPGDRDLRVSLDLPEIVRPRERLSIPVSVENLPAGAQGYVTVAAVDIGILNLTNHAAPDPGNWYFGQRGLGLEIRDLYGRLIDGSLGVAGRLRTGGDGGILIEGSPPSEQLLAFSSGPVLLGEQGNATVDFDLPEFNGTARITAVAWTAEGVGEAETEVIVRDPLVVTASAPRFLAPGDSTLMRLDIANTDAPEGEYKLSIEVEGDAGIDLGTVPETLWLGKSSAQALTLPMRAISTGEGVIRVDLEDAQGTAITRSSFVTVRPAAMPVTQRRVISLAANGGALRVDEGLLGESLLDGASVSIGVSPRAAFDIPSVLMTLDQYPYGCAEQLTSRAMPLIYTAELSRLSGLDIDPGLDAHIASAISEVLDFQTSTGGFGLWGPRGGDLWLDAYVGEFLTRASESGHPVPARAMARMIENLQNALTYTTDVEAQGAQIAYALYVLARNSRASVGDLRYYADTRIESFDSPMARAQIAAALALYGDSERAERTFASALRKARADAGSQWSARSDFGSPLRDSAAMLALAVESTPTPMTIPDMTDLVSDARRNRSHTSTQEQAWMLLAARAMQVADADIALEIDGVPHQGSFARRMSGEAVIADPLTVINRSDEPVDVVLTSVAAPTQPLPAGGDGFEIERSYYTLEGEPVNISVAQQNKRYVVVLRFVEDNRWPSQVVMTDLLPAGLVIDNPSLVGSADLAAFEWLDEVDPAHVEFRYDRFTAAFERNGDSPREQMVAYVVRAVTPGIYAHPAAIVEDMYRPQFSARTATGVMEVVVPR
jgi:uncharacterized protein YfaS (alpha-2-macroglobulin family)